MSTRLRPRRFTVDVTQELKPLYPATTRLAVLLVTYNHEAYIQKALESILFQDIELDFEIVIADDASSDGTRDLIRQILNTAGKKNYRFLDYSKNLGITKNYQRAFYACNADYIAVMEGDDYWINTGKLRMQLNYLHTHRECVAASANYFVNIAEQGRFYPRVEIKAEWTYIDARTLIRDNIIGNFSTCMFRAKALTALPPKLFDGESYDWIINITLLKYGLIGFYNEPLSVYNVHLGGTWSKMTDVERLDSQLGAIDRFNEITGQVFETDFGMLRDHLLRLRSEFLGEAENLDPRAIRNKAVMEAIQRSKFPLATRVFHAIHRRLPRWFVVAIRYTMPSALKRPLINSMTGR
jgi:glycosyltransferase involved in cell wall biosynthesis